MFNSCKYFFAPVLNALNPLHAEYNFLKPKLFTHHDESTVTYERGKSKVIVQYFGPNYIDVTIGIYGQPRNEHYFIKKEFDKECSAEELSGYISDFLKKNINEFYDYMRKQKII